MTRLLAMTTALTTTLAAGSLALAQSADSDAAAQVRDAAEATAEAAGDAVTQTSDTLGEAASETVDATGNAAEATGDAATGILAQARETATGLAEEAGQTAQEAIDGVTGAIGSAYADAEQWWNSRTAPSDDGFAKVALRDFDAAKLEGARAYDMSDAQIGEVSQVMLAQDKSLDAVHVDVGGLLGFGEHRVSVDPEKLVVTENPETGAVRVHIFATKDSLMEQPEVGG